MSLDCEAWRTLFRSMQSWSGNSWFLPLPWSSSAVVCVVPCDGDLGVVGPCDEASCLRLCSRSLASAMVGMVLAGVGLVFGRGPMMPASCEACPGGVMVAFCVSSSELTMVFSQKALRSGVLNIDRRPVAVAGSLLACGLAGGGIQLVKVGPLVAMFSRAGVDGATVPKTDPL